MLRRSPSTTIPLALLLVFTLVLSACVGPPPEEEDDAPDNGQTGRLTVALDSDVDLLEPHFFRTDAAYVVTSNLYEPLLGQEFRQDGGMLDGTDVHVGRLAESWDVSEDGLEATFVLRDDASFHDGSPITAEDVAYVFQRSIEGPGYITALLPFIGIESADQIEVVDDRTLVFRPSFSSPLFERFLTFQVFGAMHKATADEQGTDDDPWATAWFTDNATASGPYQLTSFERGREVVLDPNPNYHSPDAIRNEGINLRIVPSADERALLLQRGELDVADGLPPRIVASLEEDENLTVHRLPSSRITYLGMNSTIAPFDNKLVRQAISYAVPYEDIRDQVMYGYASIAKSPVPAAMDSYAGEEHWDYDTNLDRARELLDQAGVGDISTELVVRQAVAADGEAAVFIQDALRQIGVEVEVNRLPDAAYFERLNDKELPMFLHDWFSWGEDPFFQMQFLLQSESFTNYAQYSNPEVDSLIAEGTFELDPQRRDELSRAAQEIIIDDAPWAFLYAADYVVVTQADVTGVTRPYDQCLRFEYLTRTG